MIWLEDWLEARRLLAPSNALSTRRECTKSGQGPSCKGLEPWKTEEPDQKMHERNRSTPKSSSAHSTSVLRVQKALCKIRQLFLPVPSLSLPVFLVMSTARPAPRPTATAARPTRATTAFDPPAPTSYKTFTQSEKGAEVFATTVRNGATQTVRLLHFPLNSFH